MKPLKKLIIINSDVYIRNYLKTDALSAIEDENLYYLATDDVTVREPLEAKPNFLGYFHYAPEVFEQHLFLSHVLMLRYQDRSVTFGWRANRQLDHIRKPLSHEALSKTRTYQDCEKLLSLLPKQVAQTLSFQISRAIKFLKMPPQSKSYLSMLLYGRPGLAELYAKWFDWRVKPNAQLRQKLKEIQPDVVLLPSSAIDPLGNDLARLQRELNYKTFYLIDNWDNLSSKSVFLYQPDYLGVWGQQSVEHAQEIHQIQPNRVFKLGTPRVEDYFEAVQRMLAQGEKPDSPYEFPYALYLGCSIPFDELTSLHLLDRELVQINQYREQPLKLIYRPHPLRNKRQCPDVFRAEDFEHVILDRQIEEHYYQSEYFTWRQKGVYQPALDYYPRLLANAELAIGPLTTMLVETAIFRKKVLAIAYDDGIHVTTPKNALKYYRHFEGLTEIPGMLFCHDQDSLGEVFHQIYRTPDAEIDWSLQAEKINYYLYHDDRRYPERLKAAVEQISK